MPGRFVQSKPVDKPCNVNLSSKPFIIPAPRADSNQSRTLWGSCHPPFAALQVQLQSQETPALTVGWRFLRFFSFLDHYQTRNKAIVGLSRRSSVHTNHGCPCESASVKNPARLYCRTSPSHGLWLSCRGNGEKLQSPQQSVGGYADESRLAKAKFLRPFSKFASADQGPQCRQDLNLCRQ